MFDVYGGVQVDKLNSQKYNQITRTVSITRVSFCLPVIIVFRMFPKCFIVIHKATGGEKISESEPAVIQHIHLGAP